MGPVGWRAKFDTLDGTGAMRFKRVELRRRASVFVEVLLADLPRENCWTIAEDVGDETPDGMQPRAVWDADEVRDDVREAGADSPSAPNSARRIE